MKQQQRRQSRSSSLRQPDPYARYRLFDRPNPPTRIEHLLKAACDQCGLAVIEQGHIGRWRPDLLAQIGARRCVIEADGPHHDLPAQARKDRRRDAAMRAMGYEVWRFSQAAIVRSPVACIQQVIAGTAGTQPSLPFWPSDQKHDTP